MAYNMYGQASNPALLGELNLQVKMARMAFDAGNIEAAGHLVAASVPLLEEIVRRVGEMPGPVLLTFEQLPELSRKRIEGHFGERAREWAFSPNTEFRPTPAEFITAGGQGHFLDATCNWPIEDTGRDPYVITDGAN